MVYFCFKISIFSDRGKISKAKPWTRSLVLLLIFKLPPPSQTKLISQFGAFILGTMKPRVDTSSFPTFVPLSPGKKKLSL